MARSRPPETKSANLTIEQMRAAIPKLERRIKDLETFDVGSIRKRFDPIIQTLAKKVDGALQEILGHDTVEYREYSVRSFDTLPSIMGGGPYPLPRVHEGYRDGIEGCVLKLKTLSELFEERIADASPVEEPPSPTQAKPRFGTRQVFVVHGHDDGTKETVARYLTKLALPLSYSRRTISVILPQAQRKQGRERVRMSCWSWASSGQCLGGNAYASCTEAT